MEELIEVNTAAQAENSAIAFGDFDLMQPSEVRPPCRVLVVDDDELVRARLSSLLRSFHYDIEVAASGVEALRVLGESHCHIVLTDWQMPDMDGLTLCRHIRNSGEDGYVYLLLLTVRDAQEDMLTGLAAGADDYIVKGASVRELIARLEVARRITHVEHALRLRDHENRRCSRTDPLTGAHNLRHLVEQLPRELARSQRYGHPLAVLSCEIDDFKLIEERFGPAAAADVLREFVARSEGCIRKASDWLARIGENEFMIVLPETVVRGANRVSQKLRQNLAMEPVLTPAGALSATVSIAVTAMEPPHDLGAAMRIQEMIRAAGRRHSASAPPLIDASWPRNGGSNGVH